MNLNSNKLLAATPVPLEDLENFTKQIQEGSIGGDKEGLNVMVNQAVTIMLGIAVILAVFMIIFAGFQYMTSGDNASARDSAKKRIQAAFGGLLLAIASVLILNTINPGLTTFTTKFVQVEQPELADGKFANPIENSTFVQNGGATQGLTPQGLENIRAFNNEFGGPSVGVNWNDPNAPISKYFTVRDVTKGQAARIPTDRAIESAIITMAFELDRVVEAWGSGINFTSWNRPPAVNAGVGGAENSYHMKGIAVDISPKDGRLVEFQNWLLKNWSGGVGKYASWVHIDMRNGGRLDGRPASATW